MFTPGALGLAYSEDIVNGDNPDYFMPQIQSKYLGDSSVTILLVGTYTHSRRYVDWELKASIHTFVRLRSCRSSNSSADRRT